MQVKWRGKPAQKVKTSLSFEFDFLPFPRYSSRMDLIPSLELRVEECKRAIEKMRGDLSVYQAALDAERKRCAAPRKRGRKPGTKTSRTTVIDTPKAPTLPLTVVASQEPFGSKTMKMRKFISLHPGIPHKEVIKFAAENFKENVNFGYTTLFKMKKRGEIEIRDGNVYPLDKLLQKDGAAANA